VASRDSLANPAARDWFAAFARARESGGAGDAGEAGDVG
jgi:hypothetical protein